MQFSEIAYKMNHENHGFIGHLRTQTRHLIQIHAFFLEDLPSRHIFQIKGGVIKIRKFLVSLILKKHTIASISPSYRLYLAPIGQNLLHFLETAKEAFYDTTTNVM